MFHTFSQSMPAKRVDDVGNSYHRGNTPLFDSQLTEATYLKEKDNEILSCPLFPPLNYPSLQVNTRTLTKRLTYESEYGGDGYIRDRCLLISGLGHPSVH